MRLIVVIFSFVVSLLYRPPTSPISPESNRIFPTPTLVISIAPSPLPIPTTIPKTISVPASSSQPWGVAQQIDQHTWQIRVQNDLQMGSSDDILTALNDLRRRYGSQPLQKDDRLCAYAQIRAVDQNFLKSTDSHRGFENYLTNQNGFRKLGFGSLGENSSYGYVMSGVHLIEFVYNSDPDHSKNQLDPKWDHGCIGVAGSATDLIFATSPL